MIKKVISRCAETISKLMNLNRYYQKNKNFIETEKNLERLVDLLKHKKEIAVDIEGNSLYSNQLKICLIQISTREQDFIVDPLKIKHIRCLNEIFADSKIEKVLHGSQYDILLLYQCAGIKIKNLFDTQIAACFLGENKTGLANLVEKYFNVRLQKKYQKGNWAIRPLPEDMLEYAIMDTRYLLPLADRLKEKLMETKRFDWVKEESECRTVEAIKIKKKENSISHRKKNKSKNFEKNCERLYMWRQVEASNSKIQPHLILSQKQIYALSEKKPASLKEIFETDCLKKWQKKIFGKKIYFLLSD